MPRNLERPAPTEAACAVPRGGTIETERLGERKGMLCFRGESSRHPSRLLLGYVWASKGAINQAR